MMMRPFLFRLVMILFFPIYFPLTGFQVWVMFHWDSWFGDDALCNYSLWRTYVDLFEGWWRMMKNGWFL